MQGQKYAGGGGQVLGERERDDVYVWDTDVDGEQQ